MCDRAAAFPWHLTSAGLKPRLAISFPVRMPCPFLFLLRPHCDDTVQVRVRLSSHLLPLASQDALKRAIADNPELAAEFQGQLDTRVGGCQLCCCVYV